MDTVYSASKRMKEDNYEDDSDYECKNLQSDDNVSDYDDRDDIRQIKEAIPGSRASNKREKIRKTRLDLDTTTIKRRGRKPSRITVYDDPNDDAQALFNHICTNQFNMLFEHLKRLQNLVKILEVYHDWSLSKLTTNHNEIKRNATAFYVWMKDPKNREAYQFIKKGFGAQSIAQPDHKLCMRSRAVGDIAFNEGAKCRETSLDRLHNLNITRTYASVEKFWGLDAVPDPDEVKIGSIAFPHCAIEKTGIYLEMDDLIDHIPVTSYNQQESKLRIMPLYEPSTIFSQHVFDPKFKTDFNVCCAAKTWLLVLHILADNGIQLHRPFADNDVLFLARASYLVAFCELTQSVNFTSFTTCFVYEEYQCLRNAYNIVQNVFVVKIKMPKELADMDYKYLISKWTDTKYKSFIEKMDTVMQQEGADSKSWRHIAESIYKEMPHRINEQEQHRGTMDDMNKRNNHHQPSSSSMDALLQDIQEREEKAKKALEDAQNEAAKQLTNLKDDRAIVAEEAEKDDIIHSAQVKEEPVDTFRRTNSSKFEYVQFPITPELEEEDQTAPAEPANPIPNPSSDEEEEEAEIKAIMDDKFKQNNTLYMQPDGTTSWQPKPMEEEEEKPRAMPSRMRNIIELAKSSFYRCIKQ